ncbi:glycosyltransferase family 4 protein [Streptomyces sp. NBC_00820]|uniref:glycosyltransferase family 4 protein n=1 Tax=Streptomyces sp. NBC_00820 TaxID=2975842 RepID=UPI002ED3C8B3|nr:glycosyltransferase family 4 protein [Streptomyces sp. NBC_00820]
MRILQIVNIGQEAGGAEKSVRLITDGLRARGHEIRVVATDLLSDGGQVFADELVPAISGHAVRRFTRKLWYRQAYRQVSHVVRAFAPDCVHLHTIGEFSPSVLAATAGVPRLLTVHGPEDWTRSLLRWNLPSAVDGRLTPPDALRYAYLRWVQRPAYLPRLRRVDRVLAPSRYFADSVRADFPARVPVHVLPNGVPGTVAARPLRTAENVLYVGRLERVKGVDVLLEAFGRLDRGRLTVVGDGTDRSRLERLAGPRVTFTGWLDEAGVAERLTDASVVVLPSLWPENFPTVALEALRTGRALVASRVGGLPELVGDDNGALVPAGDAEALAGALRGLLGDRAGLERRGAASAVRAHRYTVEVFLDALEQHYKEVAGR